MGLLSGELGAKSQALTYQNGVGVDRLSLVSLPRYRILACWGLFICSTSHHGLQNPTIRSPYWRIPLI